MVLLKVADGYKKPTKTQTTYPNMLQYSLNDPKKILLMIHELLRQFFFQNWGVGALNFCLAVKNATPEGDWSVKKTFQNPY